MSHILYLTRNGLLEPLGQSQIWPYLRELSRDYSISLVTFEKQLDLSDSYARYSMEQELKSCDLRWLPLRFRSHPRPWAPLISIPHLALVALWQCTTSSKPFLIHARSYLPAAVALLLHWTIGVQFVFDMRALWPEELIAGGYIKRGSLSHRFLLWLERCCLAESSAVVSLTYSAVKYLKSCYPSELCDQRIVVIPTCCDLQRFHPINPAIDAPIVIGCIGTVISSWFMVDWLRSFYEALMRADPTIVLELVTRDSRDVILSALQPSRSLAKRLSIRAARPSDMPAIVQSHTASVMFFEGGLSKLGSCPTRMAEALACGRPVVTNAGCGDVAEILGSRNIGILAHGSDLLSMDECVSALLSLLRDPALSQRCRSAAEEFFSLKLGTDMLKSIYSSSIH